MNQLAYTQHPDLAAKFRAGLTDNQARRNELAAEADIEDAVADRLLNLYHRQRELAGAKRAASVEGLVL